MRIADISRLHSPWRATERNPGADLSRLPMGFDIRAIRVAEGVRAALACAVVILLSEWLGKPALIYMAMAAFFTCLCDIGGPIRTRVPALLSFTVAGALIWSGFGLLRNLDLPLLIPLACLGVLCTSFVRVWGAAATAVGNLLSVVLILSLDQPLDLATAGEIAGLFLLGGLWATLLTMVVWRLHPYRPARAAVSQVWHRLAELTEDLRHLTGRPDASGEDWEAHARAHRRAVREEIEFARGIVMDLVGMRGRLSLRGAQALLRLEAGEQLFGALIALSELIETARDPERRAAAGVLLRVLRPILVVLSQAILDDTALPPGRIERALATALRATEADPALRRIATSIAERLRVAAKLSTPGGYQPGGASGTTPALPWRDQMLLPVRANLTWNSAVLRHSLRTAVIAVPALAVTLPFSGNEFAHWLPITVVVTLQPFYATTWQRALERAGGTVLGGLLGAALASGVHDGLTHAALLFPLCVLAFAGRQVSFSAWMAGVTTIVVVLTELLHPTHSSWEVAGLRALFTLAGGLMAVTGWLLLWPSWEPDRMRREVRAALAAHADYARAVLAGTQPDSRIEASRRAAGVSTNNLESSLSRAMQEPGQDRARIEAGLVVDATLRRIAGRLAALRHDPGLRDALDDASWQAWAEWLHASLAALAEARLGPLPRPAAIAEGPALEPLARIVRQVELLQGPIGRLQQAPETETRIGRGAPAQP
ncbi:Integral membrane protein [Roseomonas mucosa]|uniref:FUSC family protein n=1 Tax=Roseomonas mucosa TaxID=207340 RepID=A0A1S8D591_9PROT|nr:MULTISPECIES: FUSC family protein [Roseomonas]ATR21252.1 FUSC family protein [Roseomonas sp. FDAARGOS_362]MDT8274960.1 FUSC family protein [Roseomonas mucosa]MDT8354754.1 FUSC family protein [Roseomonas mucosa]ONH82748.1 FUSC family protein [Roseomonas mucosa]QDJ09090.1 Integral membrane protein [Roseomonas mucosa]